jgi:predicted transcriptional regulator
LKKKHTPTEAELEILQILWQNGPSSVRTVNDVLNKKREVGYTTTLKIMQIMTDKGLVERDTGQRTHIYHTLAKEKDTQNNLLDSFIEKTYRGSAMRLIMQALGRQEASQQELEELKKIIDQIEKQNQ